jgi:hypothetical protein
VIQGEAVVFLAYVLGLRESSFSSLSAKIISHTAAKKTVSTGVSEQQDITARGASEYARTGFADFQSSIDLLQMWRAQRPENSLLFGLPGDGMRLAAVKLIWRFEAQRASSVASSTTGHDMDVALSANRNSH